MFSNLYKVIFILLINYSLAISKCNKSDYKSANHSQPVYYKEECRV